MKEQLGYSEKLTLKYSVVVLETPLAVIVMDLIDVHQLNAVFEMGKNRWRARVTDNRCNLHQLTKAMLLTL